MAANAARYGQSAGRDMGFEEAEIKRKMSEIADWLKSQAEPPAPAPAPPPAPRLQVVSSAPSNDDDDTLDSIIQRRMAARRKREDIEPEPDSLREVMGRFSGPIHSDSDAARRSSLNAAVAEIMERQRLLEEGERAPRYTSGMTDMEAAFQRLAEQFERRAARTFETLESSLAEVTALIRHAQPPSDAIHQRVEELARELGELRADATDSERRTRDLLDTVRQTLEHVAARLPERAPAAPVEANPSIRARAAAMRAQQESSAETAAPDLAAPVAPERRQFIAAARRAQTTAAPTAKYRAPDAPRVAYPIEAARPSTMKRTLLAGAAAAALLFGIYAGSSRFLDGIFSAPPQTQTASLENDGAARTETAAPSTPTPAEVPNHATAAPSPEMYAPPASPPAEIKPAPAEPAITGSISQTAPALDPLSVEIGGARLRTRAIAGDPAAQYEVAMRFAEGRGVARDSEKAAAWMARAAAQGLAPAQYRLGSMTEKGTGVTKDAQTARRLYEQAAAAGNTQAMHNLGVLHAEGGLGTPDMAVALVWFRKAAEHGVKDSQYNLGIFYARGLSVPQDLAQSYLWFALAAAQGDKEAASKRDQIGEKLSADKLQAMKVAADTWKPKTAPVEANEVAPPPEGWDEPANTQARTN